MNLIPDNTTEAEKLSNLKLWKSLFLAALTHVLREENTVRIHMSQNEKSVTKVTNLFKCSKTNSAESRFKVAEEHDTKTLTGPEICISYPLLASSQHVGATAAVTTLPLAFMLFE